MTFVVDASVAVKWLVNEQASEAAHRLLNSEERLVAPDFIVVEVGNVLWKKLRRGELTDPSRERRPGVTHILRAAGAVCPTCAACDRNRSRTRTPGL